MAQLVGTDGALYEIPDDNKAAAIASGQFTEAPTPVVSPVGASLPPAGPQGPAAPVEDPDKPSEPLLQVKNKAGITIGVPESKATALVADGTHTIEDVPLAGKDGKLYDIPNQNITAALQSGEFRLSTLKERDEARRASDVAASQEESGGTGLKPYVGGAVDAALTGIGVHNPIHAIGEEFESPEVRTQEQANVDKVADEHPVAYDTGAVTGEVGSAVLGGELATGVSKAVGATGLAKVALEGAVYSAEPVAKAIINKDPAGAAEALALGVGLNVGLHGIFTAVEKVPGALGSLAETVSQKVQGRLAPEVSEDEAQNLIGKHILGLGPGKIAELREQIAPALKAAGVTSEDIAAGAEKVLPKIQALEESGPAIGRAIKQLDTFEGRAPVIEEHLGRAAEDLRKLLPPEVLEKETLEASLKASKLAIKEAASQGERLAAREAASVAEARIAEIGKLDPLALQAKKALQPILDQVLSTAKKGSFEETQALKRFVGGQTKFGVDNGFANSLKKRAYGILAEHLMSAEDAAAQGLGSAAVIQGLREQRAAYTFSKMFGDAADRLATKQVPENVIARFGGVHGVRQSILLTLGAAALNPAAAVGVFAHGAVVYGVPLVNEYIRKQAIRGAAAKLLGETTAPATNTTIHALKNYDTKISDSVKGFLGSLAVRGANKALDTSGGLREFVPDRGSSYSHKTQLAALQRTVQESQTDPAKFATHLGDLTAPLRAEGLHEVADAYTQHQLRLMKVLQTILPANDLSKGAHPFAAKVETDEISPATREKYQRALTIAADPRALLQLIKTNQITQGDVAIAAAVNPSTLQKMRDALVEDAMKSKPDLTYQQRLSMGILLGQNIDESTAQISVLQSAYAPSGPVGGAPKPASKGHLSAKSQDIFSNNSLTTSQRASGHSV